MNETRLILALIFLLISIFLIAGIIESNLIGNSSEDGLSEIKYSEIECFYNRSMMVIFNPNAEKIDNVTIEMASNFGKEFYIVNREILPDKLINITLGDCLKNYDYLKITWYYNGKKYADMFNGTKAAIFQIKEEAEVSSQNESETIIEDYPVHPNPEDCLNLVAYFKNFCYANATVIDDIYNFCYTNVPEINAIKYDFCYADVAEIRNDTKYCEFVEDPEIRVFCIARVELDEEKCDEINDYELKKECIRSLGQKKEWFGE